MSSFTPPTSLQSQLIEIFLREKEGISAARLLGLTKVPIEAINGALDDLERKGIIGRNATIQSYRISLS